MDYKEALEFAIDRTRDRITELGSLATEIQEEGFASSDDRETFAALKSAEGGMMECLDLMTQCQAMAKSFDSAPAQAWADQNAQMAIDAGWAEPL
jgi:hypothetical protein